MLQPGFAPRGHEAFTVRATRRIAGRATNFSAHCGKSGGGALALTAWATYIAPRRGTESQRARPPRCEAAPPIGRTFGSDQGKAFGLDQMGSSSGPGPRHFRSHSVGAGEVRFH